MSDLVKYFLYAVMAAVAFFGIQNLGMWYVNSYLKTYNKATVNENNYRNKRLNKGLNKRTTIDNNMARGQHDYVDSD